MKVSAEEEIRQLSVGKPHVVILGAGASYADEDDLRETWSPFIHSHHYRVQTSFYDSWIANHPRRTGEAYLNQFIEAKFIENNPLPKGYGFHELWDWYDRLQDIESMANI